MTQAIEYETRWQIETLEDGGKIQQATVLFNPETGETKAMRSKEEANDYRYFPDPDLLPLEVTEADKAGVKALMPELPDAMKGRFESEYLLSSYDASNLTSSRDLANYFVETVNAGADAKLTANWTMGILSARLNSENISISDSPIKPILFASLLMRLFEGVLSNSSAKQLFDRVWIESSEPAKISSVNGLGGLDKNLEFIDNIIVTDNLKQESDSGAIEAIIDEVLAANAAMVEEFKAGKEKAFNALVGQAMKASKGKANPAQVNEVLKKKLS